MAVRGSGGAVHRLGRLNDAYATYPASKATQPAFDPLEACGLWAVGLLTILGCQSLLNCCPLSG